VEVVAAPLVTQLGVPPAPVGLIERPRLLERVGFAEPLTLVCAPAGSGKTALVAQGARGGAHRVAWVSLEPSDDDPRPLWGAVLAALDAAGAVPAGSALAGLAPPVRESRATFMPLLVNALAELPERVVLVLDDVHLLRSRVCLAELSFLVLHAPSTLRLVLIARSDPALPLHVLRVRGGVQEIRAADLAFTVAEADALLWAHGLELPEPLVAALHARTEGWAAGLRLAALGLQGHAAPERFVAEFAGDDGIVADYLVAEVLLRQPATRRAFLLRTSLVDRVCGELADALTGESNGAAMLAELERTTGFVLRVDGARGWYRYHGLLAQLLRSRAHGELAAEEAALHRRAAGWYAGNGAGKDALRHAVAAADWDLALEVVAGHWFELYVRGDADAIRGLVDVLPAERLEGDAEVSAALACAALDAGDVAGAERHSGHARAAAPGLPEPRVRRYLETMALAGLAAAGRQGDFEGALQAADELLAEAAAHPGRADTAREAVVHRMLGETALWAHRFTRAREELERAVALARTAGLEFLAVAALSDLALIDVMEGGPAAAPGHAREALELAGRRGWGGIPQVACAHVALAMAALFDLDDDGAGRHLADAAAAAAQVRRRDLDFVIAHLKARMCGSAGAPRDGLRILDDFDVVHRHGSGPPYERPALAALRARLLIAAGELEAAEAWLAPVRGSASMAVGVADGLLRLTRGEPDEAVEILAAAAQAPALHAVNPVERGVLEAVARDEAGDRAGSARALEGALALAEATRHRSPFVEAGRRMDPMLRQRIREGTSHRALVGELLDVFAGRAPAPHVVAPLLEPLSEREETVLRYLPTTLSNREIAAELFVTTNTVKTHLRSIYRKLDVAHRRDAVTRARDLRLLSLSSRR
jgi:LuxR family transcriptional regulator, maltose regulon positive regulatory protein